MAAIIKNKDLSLSDSLTVNEAKPMAKRDNFGGGGGGRGSDRDGGRNRW